MVGAVGRCRDRGGRQHGGPRPRRRLRGAGRASGPRREAGERGARPAPDGRPADGPRPGRKYGRGVREEVGGRLLSAAPGHAPAHREPPGPLPSGGRTIGRHHQASTALEGEAGQLPPGRLCGRHRPRGGVEGGQQLPDVQRHRSGGARRKAPDLRRERSERDQVHLDSGRLQRERHRKRPLEGRAVRQAPPRELVPERGHRHVTRRQWAPLQLRDERRRRRLPLLHARLRQGRQRGVGPGAARCHDDPGHQGADLRPERAGLEQLRSDPGRLHGRRHRHPARQGRAVRREAGRFGVREGGHRQLASALGQALHVHDPVGRRRRRLPVRDAGIRPGRQRPASGRGVDRHDQGRQAGSDVDGERAGGDEVVLDPGRLHGQRHRHRFGQGGAVGEGSRRRLVLACPDRLDARVNGSAFHVQRGVRRRPVQLRHGRLRQRRQRRASAAAGGRDDDARHGRAHLVGNRNEPDKLDRHPGELHRQRHRQRAGQGRAVGESTGRQLVQQGAQRGLVASVHRSSHRLHGLGGRRLQLRHCRLRQRRQRRTSAAAGGHDGDAGHRRAGGHDHQARQRRHDRPDDLRGSNRDGDPRHAIRHGQDLYGRDRDRLADPDPQRRGFLGVVVGAGDPVPAGQQYTAVAVQQDTAGNVGQATSTFTVPVTLLAGGDAAGRWRRAPGRPPI